MNNLETDISASASNNLEMDSLKHLEEHYQEKHPQIQKWYQNPVVQILYSTLLFSIISFIIIGLLTLFSNRLGEFIHSRMIYTAHITDDFLLNSANRLRIESELLSTNQHHLRALELAQNLENAATELNVKGQIVLKSIEESAPSWLQIAIAEYARQNKQGAYNNRIMQYIASVKSNTSNTLPNSNIAWSSHFVNWVMYNTKIMGTQNELPTSWLNWGKAEIKPKHGAITVFQLESSYSKYTMVGFFLLETKHYDIVLTGDVLSTVSVIAFEKSNLLGYRWPNE